MEWCSCICRVFSISTPHSCVDFFSMFSCCWICFKNCKWNQLNKQNARIEQDQVIFCLYLVYCVIYHSSTWVHCYPLRPLHRNYFRVTLFSTEKENNSQTTSCLINSVHSIFWDDQCSGRKDIDEPGCTSIQGQHGPCEGKCAERELVRPEAATEWAGEGQRWGGNNLKPLTFNSYRPCPL